MSFAGSRFDRSRFASSGTAAPSSPSGPPTVAACPSLAYYLMAAGSSAAPLPAGPADLVVFENELANWVASTLAVEAYPHTVPEGTLDYPVLVYTVVDGDSYYRSSGPDGLAWLRVQFDAYSPSYADACTLQERLRLALLPYMNHSGLMGAATVRNVTFHRPASGYDPTGTGQDNAGMHRRMREVTFWFDEATAS